MVFFGPVPMTLCTGWNTKLHKQNYWSLHRSSHDVFANASARWWRNKLLKTRKRCLWQKGRGVATATILSLCATLETSPVPI